MKRNILAPLCFFGFALTSSISQALYIEPYAGVIMSSTNKIEIPAAPVLNSESDLTGNALGLRLGWSMMGISVGVDYQMGSLTEKDTAGASVGTEEKSKITNLGAFVDFDPPVIPFHVYAAYILDSKIDPETAGDPDINGSGLKIGAGFTGLPFVAINLDYSTLKYDEATPALGIPFEANAKIIMLSVSLPLNL